MERDCPYSAIDLYFRRKRWLRQIDMPENEDAYGEHAEMVVLALLCICGGLGMLGAFFAERWLRRRDRVSAGAGDAR